MRGEVVVVLLACACGGSQHAAPAPAPTIVVLDPGAEPRQRLRYELASHASERYELDLKLRMNTALTNTVLENGTKLVDLPTIRYLLHVDATPLTPVGDARIDLVLDNVWTQDDVIDPAVRRRLDAELPNLKGEHLSWRRSPDGNIAEIKMEAPGLSSAQNERLVALGNAMTSVILPDADLGVGASWSVRAPVTIAGSVWERTVTYRLKALADSTATLEAITELHASSQAISTQPNASVRLTSGTSRETADLVVPLHQLGVTGRSESTSETNLQIVRGHLRILSTVTTETITSITRLPD